jgi:hypothetical protein
LAAESSYPIAGGFRNARDLLTQVEHALIAAKSAAIPQERREGLESVLVGVERYWLAATVGIYSEDEQRDFLQRNWMPTAAPGTSTLDVTFLRDWRSGPAPSQQETAQIGSLVQSFVRAYSTRNVAALSASTQLRASAVAQLLAGPMSLLAGKGRRATNIRLPPITSNLIYPKPECWSVYLPDVRLRVVGADGRGLPETVDRALEVCKDSAGRWKVRVFVEDLRGSKTP